MKRNILITLYLAGSMIIAGCNKYLDVTPKSQLSESQMFESEVGFQQALMGIYSQMASRSLYGDNQSMGFVSALAQNYSVSGAGAPLAEARALNYTSQQVINYTTAIWSASYTAIAGVNNIISNADENRTMFTGNNYGMIKGEALALRAFLHFELLRLFGPEYTLGKDQKAIPYRMTVDQYSQIPATTAEVVKLALDDLAAAANLLVKVDPIVSGSPNRRIKMNYYAVKALEARVRLYIGDNAGAAAAAHDVVDAGKFPFVTASAASQTMGSRDRLYITEQVFCLRVPNIKDWAEVSYFRFNGSTSVKLTQSDANFKSLYEAGTGGTGATDLRYRFLIEQDGGAPFPSKFWQTYQFSTMDSNRLDQLVPVIRLSEMYYILAEVAATPQEGVGYLNKVRVARALAELPASITATTLQNEITKEYQKEFYAEGQWFYYYKRKKMVRMRFMTKDIPLSKYVLPIPPSELEFNPNYN
ncbi:RagB/SusD family nutrient uptake outer membrane protein [Chitinophaga eiseniae]|uniref:RagB/SusD family nutrient uptake outer membrane protein n=1 Tax=Chitinophaga eiseniae TaxID=634771 RepID=A0A847SPA4_9BACT|nr:RagB/SusD family nutrient uptake outer membrane protein [Chitinophaga eiseniae]NLR79089.1 RagB/SusD family nutrient uptake outer membrane protein [Chitinophaga eiseniae]